MRDLINLTAEEIARGVCERSFSAREVTEAFLGRIRAMDGEIGAFLAVRDGAARAEADGIDRRIGAGSDVGPLAGVPVAVKDNIVMSGERVTAGSRILEHYVGSYDATVVKKLKDAGAVILGKTNLDEFAMGSSTEHSALGVTKNPHDTTRVPGGSSGGSTAAVAAHFAPVALGSDTSGSISLPSAFCGVVGLRPTYGAVSRFGLIAMASSLDQIGPIAGTVGDAAAVFRVIRGADPSDATSVEYGLEELSERTPEELVGLVVGVPREFNVPGMDPAVIQGLAAARKRFERLGVRFTEISLPHVQHALAVYYVLMPAEVSANLARFDGVRYGGITDNRQPTTDNLHDLYLKTRGIGFGPEVRRRILLGTFVLSSGYYDAYYAKAEKVRRLIADDFARAFDPAGGGVDVIFAPVTPTPAFRFGEKTADPLAMYLSDIFTTQVNLAGLPSLTVPVKKYAVGSGELPVGFQLIGRKFREQDLFGLGTLYEDSPC
ncbi:MAG: Asp-tRNA(Asn)/Glu-tRNA(Gln) amidotransferase subunit GatA [bacterium]|nr:Asp-tRNA(Asn)/Glu-tRNA(Gln) amidotransferase subunit GatA [bacterium]